MRSLPIDLDELVLALDSDGMEFYLDLETGEVLFRPEDDVDAELERLLDKKPKRFLLIEPWGSDDGFHLMQQFVRRQVNDDAARRALEEALEGRRPFRAFKDRLYDFPDLRDAWHRFEAAKQRDWALHWLVEQNIEALPVPPPDV